LANENEWFNSAEEFEASSMRLWLSISSDAGGMDVRDSLAKIDQVVHPRPDQPELSWVPPVIIHVCGWSAYWLTTAR
jgi:hypothetical protein